MKKRILITLIVAGSLAATGGLLAFVGLASVGFNVNKLSTFQGYDTEKVEVASTYSSIYIDESNNDFSVSLSPDSFFHISYSENEVEKVNVVNADNKLTISRSNINNYFHPWYFPTEDKIMDILVPFNYSGKLTYITLKEHYSNSIL